MNASIVLDELDDIIYISSVEDNELLYTNNKAKIFFNIKNEALEKRYDDTVKADINCFTDGESAAERKYIHPETKDPYLMRDKYLILNDRKVRLTTAVKGNYSYTETERQLETERLLVKCIKILLKGIEFSSAINEVLANIGAYYEADAVSLFNRTADSSVFQCPYQWRSETAAADNLKQCDTVEYSEDWLRIFSQLSKFEVNDVDRLLRKGNIIYEHFRGSGINNLVSVPLIMNNNVYGFIRVANPKNRNAYTKLIEELSFIIIKELHNTLLLDKLEKASYYDASTGVFNRNKYIENVSNVFIQSSNSLGVVFSDIDNLKTINDTYGHDQGDLVIAKTSDILKKYFRAQDIYRIGGDEFVVICKDIPYDVFTKKVEDLKDALKNETFSLSVGSAWSQDKKDLSALIKEADNAMYSHKRVEKNDVV